jgi:type IV secretory pathway VirB4 component
MGAKKKPEASTQAYLPISEIKEGVVVMNDKSLRAVVIVSSLNFALKSDDEKNSVLVSYQEFLNSLGFPIQILCNSRNLDLTNYLSGVSEMAKQQVNPLLKLQTEEYRNFIDRLLTESSIMEKRFYVIVPLYPSGVEVPGQKNLFGQKDKNATLGKFEDHKKQLLSRVEEIINGLSSIGLRCSTLSTEELLELYYSIYNPDIARSQKITEIKEFDVSMTTGAQGSAQGMGGKF